MQRLRKPPATAFMLPSALWGLWWSVYRGWAHISFTDARSESYENPDSGIVLLWCVTLAVAADPYTSLQDHSLSIDANGFKGVIGQSWYVMVYSLTDVGRECV